MSSIILIGSSILLSLIGAHLLIQRFNLLEPFKKETNNSSLFLSNEEALKLICQKAELNDEEKEHLAILFTFISGNRLHQGFEVKEVTDKWLLSARRAIVNNTQFDTSAKEELEYSAYEIYRKINNVRMITHPSVKYISDLNVGQPLTVTFMSSGSISAVLNDCNFYSFSLEVGTAEMKKLPKQLAKKRVQISLWKIMDAQYSFITHVTAVEKKSNTLTIICSHPKKITCTRIRSYPRQEVEIPIKFRQASMVVDSDTGGLSESLSGVLFGVINNLGPWGCSLISYLPIPVHTILTIEIPLFSDIIFLKGIVRNLSKRGDIFIFNIEFAEDTPKLNTLTIYHYLFAEDSSKSTI